MINYLVNFTLCSALLLLAYQLLLKNKTTYNFNRFYLLFAMVFSVSVPFVVLTRTAVTAESVNPVQAVIRLQPDYIIQRPDKITEPIKTVSDRPHINYIPYIVIAIYSIITLLLFYRLIKNLNTIQQLALKNERISYKNARLVLIGEELTPHTFFNYIFINKDEYHCNKIEADVLKHELTHARQHHSADVIFIELVQAVCWFNPFIMLYRKAIQLNHEFIADAAVLNNNNDVQGYQYLLLGKSANLQSLAITSQFNYSATKKRLIMMSKSTSAATAMFARLAVIPVMAAAFILFCTKTDAQQPVVTKQAVNPKATEKVPAVHAKKGKVPQVVRPDYPSTKEGVSEESLERYAAIVDKYYNPKVRNTRRAYTPADYDSLVMMYKQMSREQQQKQVMKFLYYKQPLSARPPNQEDYELWKNADIYGVWINNKHVANTELDKYKASDFKYSFASRLLKAARVNKTYRYQVDLMTIDYFDMRNKKVMESPPITIIQYGFMKSKDKS